MLSVNQVLIKRESIKHEALILHLVLEYSIYAHCSKQTDIDWYCPRILRDILLRRHLPSMFQCKVNYYGATRSSCDIQMAYKTLVTPFLTHWSHHYLALSHRYVLRLKTIIGVWFIHILPTGAVGCRLPNCVSSEEFSCHETDQRGHLWHRMGGRCRGVNSWHIVMSILGMVKHVNLFSPE